MKKIIVLFSILIFQSLFIFSQATLKPSIGIGSLPSDGDSMCYAPWYLGGFDASGLQAGDTAYDFTLYDLNGDPFNLADALNSGTPVLLVAGSYTCPVFRGKIPEINQVVSTYGNQLKVAVIYTIEAHPNIDTSVYFGYVNPTTTNIQAGILYRQPNTYGERKFIAQELLDSMTINAPVYIDGPCNNWWSTYGPAPNNSYLIDTTGIVFSHHGWFDRFPRDIFCDIDSLLGTSSGLCSGGGPATGAFTFNLISNDTVYDVAGSTISIDGELVNNDAVNDVQVYVRRLINNIPTDWGSSLCIDVCYSTSTDSVVFLLPAGSTQSFHFYFYTSAVANSGKARVGFKNLNDSTNSFSQNLFGITTDATTGINNVRPAELFVIYPNPASSKLNFSYGDNKINSAEISDLSGRTIISKRSDGNLSVGSIEIPDLENGVYFLCVVAGDKKFLKSFVVVK